MLEVDGSYPNHEAKAKIFRAYGTFGVNRALGVNAIDERFILVRALLSSNSLYFRSACLLRWIDCMIVRVKGGAPYLSLYRGEGKGTYLVLVGYNRRLLILL